eukprot:17845-Heterococcus_DN1.PRE.2
MLSASQYVRIVHKNVAAAHAYPLLRICLLAAMLGRCAAVYTYHKRSRQCQPSSRAFCSISKCCVTRWLKCSQYAQRFTPSICYDIAYSASTDHRCFANPASETSPTACSVTSRSCSKSK